METTSNLTKSQLREKILTKRDQLSQEERQQKSLVIQNLLLKWIEQRQLTCILSYIHFKSEVATDLIWQHILQNETILGIPRVEKTELKFYQVQDPETETHRGYYGLNEPIDGLQEIDYTRVDCAILPGTAFDLNGNRMGYGKGFYDRFLLNNPHIVTLALGFECQMIKKIPVETHDRKMNYIITEKKIYNF